ncbi:hypothetical protein H8E52_02285 [bacterium]|nr:hypothetical protein [bacterium]
MSARPNKGPARRMTIYLRPPEAIEKLKIIAVLEDKSVIDLFNEAVADFLKMREKKHKAALTSVLKARQSK